MIENANIYLGLSLINSEQQGLNGSLCGETT